MEKYENRLICYLDVLGYSSMVKQLGIDEVYRQYATFIDTARHEVFYGTPDDYKGPKDNFEVSEIFSDSILLVSHDISNIAVVNNFIGSIHLFLELGLRNNFMFRGCISQGDIVFDKARGIVLSEEFNEMAKFEPKIEIPTCVIFNKASSIIFNSIFGEKQADKGVKPSRSLPVIMYDIPLKGERTEKLWCINYTYFCDKNSLENALTYLSGAPEKKENFDNYLAFLKLLPEEILRPETKVQASEIVRVMKSRTGMRVAFVRDNGIEVRPTKNMGFPTAFIEPPEEISVTVDPKTQELNFQAKGRWKY